MTKLYSNYRVWHWKVKVMDWEINIITKFIIIIIIIVIIMIMSHVF